MAYNTNYQTNYGAGGAPPQPAYPPQGEPADLPPYSAAAGTGAGWKDENNAGAETSFAGNSFSDKSIRRRFIRKVYLILFCQLIVTAAFVAFFVLHEPTRNWVREHRAIYFVSYGVFLVTYIALICCPNVRRNFPMNYIMLSIFTLAFSYMAAMIASFHKAEAVLFAFGIATVVCLAVTVFAMQTKFDITACSSMLFSLLLVLILFGFGVMIVYAVGVDNKTRWILQLVYGSLGAIVFTLFLAYDTQLLMGGRKYEISEEEYVFAAIQIYLDVVYIFLFILSMFGGKD